MPEGFAFPVNHAFWIPWRADAASYQPRTGPHGRRLRTTRRRCAPSSPPRRSSRRLAGAPLLDSPSTHQHLRPRVMPYVYAFTDMGEPDNFLAMRAIQVALVLLLIVVCVNVAILVYARTATRQGEIAVRAALGASRGRIVGQLFVEALDVGRRGGGDRSVSRLGRAADPRGRVSRHRRRAHAVLDGVPSHSRQRHGLSSRSRYSRPASLASLPALKATNTHVQTRLQTLAPGSGSRMQMGRLWTLLIVAQVATDGRAAAGGDVLHLGWIAASHR